jgi:hypothetical protein
MIMAKKQKSSMTETARHDSGALVPTLTPFEVEQLESQAVNVMPAILKRWLPDGRISNQHWSAPHPKNRTRTLSVDLLTGAWREFPTGASGRTITSLIIHFTGLPQEEALLNLTAMIGDRHVA